MKTLAYPEFTLPASLAILIGMAFLCANILIEQQIGFYFAVSAYLIITGIGLARRNLFGTALLVIGLLGVLVTRLQEFIEHGMTWNSYEVIKLLLALLILVSIVSAIVLQFNYFKNRSGKAN